ncbi:hypothetical protein LTR53_001108 [Teratosphaeriaceae sp. CCFEE 6253]|nr:hypothetical protein LTR53_001108 [Teratosphaeriaceae sp. CCFEE 6253]
MAYETQPAFVSTGTWNATTRSHPAMKWMEHYTTTTIDGRQFAGPSPASATSVGHTADWTLQKSTGEVVEGAEKAWVALAEVYAPFAAHVHDPVFLVCWETAKGWDMLGIASLWYNLQAPGEGKIKGFGGEEWDGVLPSEYPQSWHHRWEGSVLIRCVPGAFKFSYVKGGKDGVELARTEIYSDPSAALVQMLKRGMLTPEQLMQ